MTIFSNKNDTFATLLINCVSDFFLKMPFIFICNLDVKIYYIVSRVQGEANQVNHC